jgi:hypothetical protein
MLQKLYSVEWEDQLVIAWFMVLTRHWTADTEKNNDSISLGSN